MNRRTKALAIPREVKLLVASRDSIEGWPCCLYCGKPAPTSDPLAFSCAHFVPRSHGGLGKVENILTLCVSCHEKFDFSDQRQVMREYFKRYLQIQHPGWNEADLIYKK